MKKAFLCLLLLPNLLSALCGKVDIGPAYVRLDILESGKTVNRVNMAAVKADATVVLIDGYGLALKPNFIYGKGDHSELITGSLAIAHCTPIYDCFVVTPSVGYIVTHISTLTDIPFLGLTDLREHFHSYSPFVALEATYTFSPGWRICAMYQYAWSRTKTTITDIGTNHSKPEGPSYAAMIEYDVTNCFSINLGAAYNMSLTKEKHGIRASGVKLGFAYWF